MCHVVSAMCAEIDIQSSGHLMHAELCFSVYSTHFCDHVGQTIRSTVNTYDDLVKLPAALNVFPNSLFNVNRTVYN